MWRLLSIALVATLASCVPVPTPPITTIEAPPAPDIRPLRPGEAVAVLSDDLLKSRWTADCVRDGLVAGLPANRTLDGKDARDILFPWLEPEYIPQHDASVRELVSHHAVATKLQELQIRYLILIRREVDLSAVGVEGALVGMGGWKTVDRASARLIDVEKTCCRSGGSVRSAALEGYAHATIWGFIAFSFTERAACHALRDSLVKALRPPAPPGANAVRSK